MISMHQHFLSFHTFSVYISLKTVLEIKISVVAEYRIKLEYFYVWPKSQTRLACPDVLKQIRKLHKRYTWPYHARSLPNDVNIEKSGTAIYINQTSISFVIVSQIARVTCYVRFRHSYRLMVFSWIFPRVRQILKRCLVLELWSATEYRSFIQTAHLHFNIMNFSSETNWIHYSFILKNVLM